jgi:ribosomal protein S18 acetylase RimI-like enzyme
MQELVATAWRLEGPLVHRHIGDVAWGRWSIAGREHEWRFRLWEDAGEVVAWAWLHLPSTLDFQLHPRRRELLDEVLDWFEAQANGERATSALVEDAETVAGLERRGYRRAGADEPWFAYLSRPVAGAEVPPLPEGFTLRHVRGEEDVARRVEVHRAAWNPSRVTEESHRHVMAAYPYRRELDCVVEAPDGSFAASCLAWLDEENRVGELEPVGTDPRFRRRGLGAAVCTYALAQLRAHGAEIAIVYARGDSAYPAPRRLYESIGFHAYASRRSWYCA